MKTTVAEIAPNIYRLSTFVPNVGPTGFTFNQFLIDADEPLLFHYGQRSLFPLIVEAVKSVIPLGKLRLSEANVRKNDSNLFIEELAANIEAKGLLQNLIVVPAKKRGMFDVTAGGRRLRALNFLLGAGKLPKDHPVACRVLDIDAAEQSELSLIENVIRLDMTPTDEIRAYKHFVNEGSDLDAIAKRFGRTRRFIEGRLRLADLADPDLLLCW